MQQTKIENTAAKELAERIRYHNAEAAAVAKARKERLAAGHYLRRPKGRSWIPPHKHSE